MFMEQQTREEHVMIAVHCHAATDEVLLPLLLGEEPRNEVGAHVETCRDCRERLKQLRREREMLQEAAKFMPPSAGPSTDSALSPAGAEELADSVTLLGDWVPAPEFRARHAPRLSSRDLPEAGRGS